VSAGERFKKRSASSFGRAHPAARLALKIEISHCAKDAYHNAVHFDVWMPIIDKNTVYRPIVRDMIGAEKCQFDPLGGEPRRRASFRGFRDFWGGRWKRYSGCRR